MKASIDDLLSDINKSERAEIIIMIHTGSEVITKPYYYTNLRLSKDSKGTIALGNYETKEGYIITDENEIIKVDSSGGRIGYKIKKNGISLVNIYLN